ncbi:MAG: hypothetical protein R2822_25620 [Spirosomataceae bacterium]
MIGSNDSAMSLSFAPFDDHTTLDIRFEGDTATLIRHKHWTTVEIETQVSRFVYTGENLPKDPAVEKAKLPPFVLPFYKFIFFKGRLPDENELWTYYLSQHFKVIDTTLIQFQKNGKMSILPSNAVKARLLRSYPSLIRDFHFFVLCQESKLFERVSYSLREDYFDGVDLQIQYQNVVFRVAILLNSERARTYKAQKQNRHTNHPQNEVILLFDLYKNVHVSGQIKLFTLKHVKELHTELQKNYDELSSIP